MADDIGEFLSQIYYNPEDSGSFGGVDRLWRSVKKSGKEGITKKDVKQWLKTQDVYTIYRPARRNFPRRKVFVSQIDEMWECDLIDMKSFDKFNEGYRYLLVVIDALSKYLMVQPIQRKTADTTVKAFSKIFKNGRKPSCMRSDRGGEFIGVKVQRYLKQMNVRYFVTSNETKACFAERVIRTLKSRMWRYFEHKETNTYIQVLGYLVHNYNNSYHRTIRMTPASVTRANDHIAWENTYVRPLTVEEKKRREEKIKFKFEVGQYVRYSYLRATFDKSYEEQWSGELFKITKKLYTRPPTYKLSDYSGEKLVGSAYEQEIQHVIKSPDSKWKIDEVLKEERRNGKPYYFVSWKSWPKKYNSWVSADDISDL